MNADFGSRLFFIVLLFLLFLGVLFVSMPLSRAFSQWFMHTHSYAYLFFGFSSTFRSIIVENLPTTMVSALFERAIFLLSSKGNQNRMTHDTNRTALESSSNTNNNNKMKRSEERKKSGPDYHFQFGGFLFDGKGLGKSSLFSACIDRKFVCDC